MEYTFSELNEDSLTKLYIEYGFTAKSIGNFVGLNESSILLKLKNLGINNQRGIKKEIFVEYTGKIKSEKFKLTSDVLKDLYVEKKLSDKDIGLIFNMTGEGVAYRRKKLGIKTRDMVIRRIDINHNRGFKDLSELSEEELKSELFCCRGIKGVSKKYSSTFISVKKLLKKFDIDRNKCLLNYCELTEIQKKLIIGGLLGDGGVYYGGFKGFFYKEAHCIQQLEYVKWKTKILESILNGGLYYNSKISELGLESHLVSFKTKKLLELSWYREKFYKIIDNKPIKIIPESLYNLIDPFVFSVWYFDDGGLSQSKRCPYICSGSPYTYVEKVAEYLNERYELGCVTSQDESVNMIYFNNVENFYNLIKNYILPCFYYKVPVEYRFQISGLRLDLVNLSEKIKNYTPVKWRDLPEKEKEIWISDVAKYYSHKGFPFYNIKSQEEVNHILNKLIEMDIVEEIESKGVFNKVNPIGNELVSSYFPHMWAARVQGKRSAYNNYEDSKKFKHAIKNVFKYRAVLTDASIRSELRHGSTVHNFKPLIAKTIFDMYCPENGIVFDFSAGYGGRLLGAYASKKVLKYIGTDPCEQTFFGLRKIMRRLNKYNSLKKIEILNNCSENEDSYKNLEKVDMCFSSPPYFDTEKYSEENTQSYKKYPSIELWLSCFLYKMIDNCWGLLKDNGYFVINIADILGVELQRYTYEYLSKIFLFEKILLIRMPSYFGKDKFEPIFVFKKSFPNNSSYEDIKLNIKSLSEKSLCEKDFNMERKSNTCYTKIC